MSDNRVGSSNDLLITSASIAYNLANIALGEFFWVHTNLRRITLGPSPQPISLVQQPRLANFDQHHVLW